MNLSSVFVVISVVILAIIALVTFLTRKGKKSSHISPLAGIAFGCILAGILFSADRWFSYGLLGIGMLLAVVDIFKRSTRK